MIVEKSPLILCDFFLLKSDYRFVFPEKSVNADNVKKWFDNYKVDVDFQIQGEQTSFNVYVKMLVNYEEEVLPGYSMFAEGVGMFKFEGEGIDEKGKSELMHYSAVPIVINSLRTYIGNQTAYGPWGKFVVPTFDLNALFAAKEKQSQ